MNIKSMQQSIVLILIMLTAVVLTKCPCNTEDKSISEEKCKEQIKCYETNKAQCEDDISKIMKGIVDATECKLSKMCASNFVLPLVMEAAKSKTKEELKSLKSEDALKMIYQKVPCTKKLEEDKCDDKAEAEKCIKKMFPTNQRCVDAVVKECDIDKVGKVNEEAVAVLFILMIIGIVAVVSSVCMSVIGFVVLFMQKK